MKTNIHFYHISLSSSFIEKYFGQEKRGTTFRSSTDESSETLTWNNKTR